MESLSSEELKVVPIVELYFILIEAKVMRINKFFCLVSIKIMDFGKYCNFSDKFSLIKPFFC